MSASDAVEETWRKFCSAKHTLTETPGTREAWHRGRPRFAVWLARLDDERVTARFRTCVAALAPWITPQHEQDLHVTLWVAGFPVEHAFHDDEVAWTALEAQRAALSALARAGHLRIGGLCSFLSVPFLAVRDECGLLGTLRDTLALYTRELRFEAYVPHVTLGKYHGAHPTQDIARAIEPFLQLTPLEVPITSVELVEVHTFADAPLTSRWRVALRS